MGMEAEGLDQSMPDQSMQGSGEGLDHHHPHPYEVEVRAFHYMPAQVTKRSAPRIGQFRRISRAHHLSEIDETLRSTHRAVQTDQ